VSPCFRQATRRPEDDFLFLVVIKVKIIIQSDKFAHFSFGCKVPTNLHSQTKIFCPSQFSQILIDCWQEHI
jgi:hypothetical protein